MQNISRTSEVGGGNRWGMLLLFPDIAHEKVRRNLLKFDQLMIILYSLSSFFLSPEQYSVLQNILLDIQSV